MTTTRPRTDATIHPHAGARPGVALLLVVMTMATATVLTTSFLITRETAPEIGQAAQDRVTSDWAARSAAAIVEAAMETTVDWRTPANAGMLLEDVDLLGAEVNVAVTNLEGGPVEDDDRQVLMTVSASIGGIETVVQRVIYEQDDATYDEALDPELNEFGLYAAKGINVDGTSRIRVWEQSPAARVDGTAKLGFGFTSAAAVSARDGSFPKKANGYTAPGTSAGMESMLSSYNVDASELPVEMWSTTAEIPTELMGLAAAHGTMMPITVMSDRTLTGGGYGVIVAIANDAEVVLDEAEGPYLFAANNPFGDGLYVDNATIVVRGKVIAGVVDSVTFDDTAFRFEPGASLTFYHGSGVVIDDSVIGADPELIEQGSRSHSDLSTWTDPRRMRFVQLNLNALDASNSVVVRGNSLVAGSMHAPTSIVTLDERSVLAGRVSSAMLNVLDRSAMLVDPIFDNGMGLTSPKTSPLYDTDGNLIAGLRSAMESTTGDEGMTASKTRVMSTLPPLPTKDNTPVAGATRRHAGTVIRMREWPVRVRQQEQSADVLFEPPQNEAVADGLGSIVGRVLDIVADTGDAVVEGVDATTKTALEILADGGD